VTYGQTDRPLYCRLTQSVPAMPLNNKSIVIYSEGFTLSVRTLFCFVVVFRSSGHLSFNTINSNSNSNNVNVGNTDDEIQNTIRAYLVVSARCVMLTGRMAESSDCGFKSCQSTNSSRAVALRPRSQKPTASAT